MQYTRRHFDAFLPWELSSLAKKNWKSQQNKFSLRWWDLLTLHSGIHSKQSHLFFQLVWAFLQLIRAKRPMSICFRVQVIRFITFQFKEKSFLRNVQVDYKKISLSLFYFKFCGSLFITPMYLFSYINENT